MPKGDDYSRGKIYKLECLTTGKVYIGSTIQKYLSQRTLRSGSVAKRVITLVERPLVA
jgi:hypothetical protein